MKTHTVQHFIQYHHSQTGEDLTPEFYRFIHQMKSDLRSNLDLLIAVVCDEFDIEVEPFKNPFASKEGYKNGKYPEARYVVMKILRDQRYSLPEIGELLGGRHHATVLNGLKQYEDFYLTEKEFKRRVDNIHKIINLEWNTHYVPHPQK